MRTLPPLAALRAFEAAARHLSFKAAAEELAVTPTAISHQVRLLEGWLGRRLFERRTRQVTLNQAGRALLPALRDGFDGFERAITAVREAPPRPTVTLTATAAFTAHWLIPRLAAFHADEPAIDLRLLARDEPIDLAAGAADIAVRYGWGPYPDLEVRTLIADSFAAVASPDLPAQSAEAVARARLIHFDWRRPMRAAPDWPQWLAAAGVGGVARPSAGDLRFSEESHAIEAAIAGHGVALLSTTLVAGAVARGLLRRLPGPVLEGPTFHVAWSRGRALPPEAEQVRRWLVAQARDEVRTA